MPEGNVEIVRRIYEAWNSNDPGSELFDPSFELHQGPGLLGSVGVFRGHDGLLQAALELFRDLRDLSWKPDDFVAAPDGRVVVPFRFRSTGRGSGIPVEVSLIHVWALRDGLAIRCDTYEGDLADALKAVGLSE